MGPSERQRAGAGSVRASVCAFVICQREWECLCLRLGVMVGGGAGKGVGARGGGSAGLRWRRATRYFQGRATQEVSLARPPLPHWLDLLRQNSRTLPNPSTLTSPASQLHPSSYLVHARRTRPSQGEPHRDPVPPLFPLILPPLCVCVLRTSAVPSIRLPVGLSKQPLALHPPPSFPSLS